MSNFSFSHSVFKRLVLQTHKKQVLFGKGLTHSLIHHFETISKFKENADNNWYVAIKGFQDTDCIENIVENSEIAHFEQFHFF